MSLFQCREWWSFRPDTQEECDVGCLCVANIDNNKNKQGMYRFNPLSMNISFHFNSNFISSSPLNPFLSMCLPAKIVTGNFAGALRIFRPSSTPSSSANPPDSSASSSITPISNVPYHPSHLLLQQYLDQPILQLAAGHFTTDTQLLTLAVLHPKNLVIYAVCLKSRPSHASLTFLLSFHL